MDKQLQKPKIWDTRFFEMCHLVSSWSEDTSRTVGAVIVGSANQIVSTGYNGLPRGVKISNTRLSRDNGEKYHWFEHAERNAIYNAVRSGVSLERSRIYTSMFPCADCTRAIIQSGIIELCTYVPPQEDITYSRSFEVSIEMLEEAKISVQLFER